MRATLGNLYSSSPYKRVLVQKIPNYTGKSLVECISKSPVKKAGTRICLLMLVGG